MSIGCSIGGVLPTCQNRGKNEQGHSASITTTVALNQQEVALNNGSNKHTHTQTSSPYNYNTCHSNRASFCDKTFFASISDAVPSCGGCSELAEGPFMMGESKHGAWLNILKFTVPISSIKIELPLASQKDTRNQTADINLHAKVTDTAPLHHLRNLLGVGSLQRNRRQARVSTLD